MFFIYKDFIVYISRFYYFFIWYGNEYASEFDSARIGVRRKQIQSIASRWLVDTIRKLIYSGIKERREY